MPSTSFANRSRWLSGALTWLKGREGPLTRPPVSEISIIARGNVGGYSAWQGVSSSLQTRADLEAHIQTLLAGRCAEIAVFGQASSGAGGDQDSDLGQATRLLTFLEAGLGLGAALTFRSGYETTLELLSGDAQLRTKVEKRLQHLHKVTLKLVNTHRGQILKVAEELIQQRCINGDRFRQLLTEDVI
ncbi:hypothetical protein [Pelagibacterium lentulum]|uniref:hypothetical protein n=1 Tax=Pelagibacterium lentulum TaxID=2029865 RepID=UPI0013DF2F81|nr:hypothetical protein [Pelagibacterium lentulum]